MQVQLSCAGKVSWVFTVNLGLFSFSSLGLFSSFSAVFRDKFHSFSTPKVFFSRGFLVMEPMDIYSVESKLSDVTVTPIPMVRPAQSAPQSHYQPPQMSHGHMAGTSSATISTAMASASGSQIPPATSNTSGLSKYAQLLAVIEEMGRDIRPSYSGSRSSAERLKRVIVHARILVRECLLETERSARN
ncbi:cyclin-dependent kinase 2-associated protein 1 [Phlebotomus papatasi]|uniref:cyclin-dependent kinase 2-associated protein 1 n=1 Tax=Phlebotomus papatasi TaxID=29031 RepID=UPI002483318C|nr:cyclin-dependent kinase 2-associated protein 1 [Phlebotomus papatasi]